MDEILNSTILQIILAISTLLGGMSACIHIFFKGKTNSVTIDDNTIVAHENINKHVNEKADEIIDVKHGLIETFNRHLIINGDVINFHEISVFKISSIYKHKEKDSFLFMLVDTIITNFVGDKNGVLNPKTKIFLLFAFINILLIGLLSNLSNEIAKKYLLFVFLPISFFFMALFLIHLFFTLILVLITYIDPAENKINYIEIGVSTRKTYQVWIDEIEYSTKFHEAYNRLKDAIFSEGNPKVKLTLYSHNGEVVIQ